jgi:hypothetical protein
MDNVRKVDTAVTTIIDNFFNRYSLGVEPIV